MQTSQRVNTGLRPRVSMKKMLKKLGTLNKGGQDSGKKRRDLDAREEYYFRCGPGSEQYFSSK